MKRNIYQMNEEFCTLKNWVNEYPRAEHEYTRRIEIRVEKLESRIHTDEIALVILGLTIVSMIVRYW